MVSCFINNFLTTASRGIVKLFELFQQRWLWRSLIRLAEHSQRFHTTYQMFHCSTCLSIWIFVVKVIPGLPDQSFHEKTNWWISKNAISWITFKRKIEYDLYFYLLGCCYICSKKVFVLLGSMGIKVLAQWFQMSVNIIYLI